jgi:cobalt-zinc-cadmium efflux system protein
MGNIRLAFFLNLSFSLIELVGGLWIGSLAIVADSVHDFGDSISLGLAWVLERLANRRKDQQFNFGYRRFSLLSALISGVIITAGSVVIVSECLRRFTQAIVTEGYSAQAPASGPMIGLAILGLAVNGLAAWRLSKGATQNEKVLTWHLIEDMAGWGIVLIGAIVIALTGWWWIDPLLAFGLALFVAFNVLRHLKDTAYLFLQGRPTNFDESSFLKEALAVEGVEKIDHLAVWSLDGETSVLSARVHLHSVREPHLIEVVKTKIKQAARKQNAQATIETCLSEDSPHEQH